MNKIFISGNLTKDPEVRYTQNGKATARSSIAVNRGFGDKQTTDFFNLVAWDKTAEFFGKYLKKGSKILVEGRLQNNHYSDKNDTKHYSEDIVVVNVEFAGGKSDKKSDEPQNEFDGEPVNDDDTPF